MKTLRLLLPLAIVVASPSLYAASGTWLASPVDNEWTNPANWSSGTVPGQDDTATLAFSQVTSLAISGSTVNHGIVFAAGGSAFTISPSTAGGSMECRGSILNESGVVQNFVLTPDAEGNGTYMSLFNFPNEDPPTVDAQVTFTQESPSEMFFSQAASAGQGTYINEAAKVSGGLGGLTAFFGNSFAGESVVINRGATVEGAGGGRTIFQQLFPSAEDATLIAESGSNGGAGGTITFYDSSLGGTTRVEVFGNGYVDLNHRSGSQGASITFGSIEGDGQIYLGHILLLVGSSNLSTTFSGVLHPAGPTGGGGSGVLSKIGSGTLTLAGANLYSGGTTVSAGVLAVSNTTGSGTGTGAVTVNGGTLGGSGTISGAVTVNSSAFLAPAAGTKKQATLTIQSALNFNAGSTYTCTFKAKENKALTDKVVANGVTIASGASFNFNGQVKGTLRTGLTLTVISNTSGSAISGTFSNLPDGAILTVGSNNFQANYEGGDGNDLTLTVQ